jgi:hypothetical protein
LSTSAQTLAERIEQEKRNFRLYSDAIALYSSIRLYLQTYSFDVYVEPTLRIGVEAQPTIPDLLIKTIADWTVIEHKGSLPRNRKQIASELEEIKKYGQTCNFKESTFTPKVVLLCPRKLSMDLVAQQQKKELTLPTLISYSPPTERICTLSTENGLLGDVYLLDLFDKCANKVEMKTDILERYKYKFIRREPPIPYTTHFIWAFINLEKNAFQKKITVQYDSLLKVINSFCPPWCVEARQLSEGRLNKAIEFLKQLGWVKYDADTKELTADTSRGTKAGRMEEYLCEKFVIYSEETSAQEPSEAKIVLKPLDQFF